MSRWRLGTRFWALLVSAGALVVALAWAAVPSEKRDAPLAAMLPMGALMTVESADFGALVAAWSRSPEQRAWLSSASYSAFANSRLFTRLQDAQSSFADAAKTSVDGDFLAEIAGKESVFAWYDIGNLQFLYITRLPQDRLAKLSLMAQRGSFARREAGGTAFYLRTSSASGGPGTAGAAGADDAQGAATEAVAGQARTVAFAVHGEWLLLATREDLIAGALQLMAGGKGADGVSASQATEAWYAAAGAAGPVQAGDLHMMLNLQALSRTPQFRTYWIQGNVTDTRQYRAAVVDLYRESGQFREERVLLPMQPETGKTEEPDLGSLEALVPERAGVYRAWAYPRSGEAMSALREKVLSRESSAPTNDKVSPEAQTAVAPAGSAGEFETRIDAPQRVTGNPEEQFAGLQKVVDGAALESILTVDRTDPPSSEDAFVHVRSAVVLRAVSAWDKEALSAAVLGSLRARLTTAPLGPGWTNAPGAEGGYLTLGNADPVCLFVDGPLAIVSSDPRLMEDILRRRAAAGSAGKSTDKAAGKAWKLAAFRHDQERAHFRELSADLNMTQNAKATSPGSAANGSEGQPVDLFRDNLPSLSDAFRAMASERFAETFDSGKVHQTVVYRWAGQ